jgi:hypothetical protein
MQSLTHIVRKNNDQTETIKPRISGSSMHSRTQHQRHPFTAASGVLFFSAALFLVTGCKTSDEPNPSFKTSKTAGGKLQSNSHLLTPPNTDDLTKLSASQLIRKLEVARMQLDKDLNTTLKYATQYQGDNLQRDVGYLNQIRTMKKAETELARLEDEIIRRKQSSH